MDILFSSWQKDPAKLIQIIVFIALVAALGWCFWVYYDISQKIEKTGTSSVVPPTNVNEAKINEVLDKLDQRQVIFNAQINISYDPFQ